MNDDDFINQLSQEVKYRLNIAKEDSERVHDIVWGFIERLHSTAWQDIDKLRNTDLNPISTLLETRARQDINAFIKLMEGFFSASSDIAPEVAKILRHPSFLGNQVDKSIRNKWQNSDIYNKILSNSSDINNMAFDKKKEVRKNSPSVYSGRDTKAEDGSILAAARLNNIRTTINKLPDIQTESGINIRSLLSQLTDEIEKSSLDEKQKRKATRYIEQITKVAENPSEEDNKDIAEDNTSLLEQLFKVAKVGAPVLLLINQIRIFFGIA